jgi:hypothetical protein
LGIALFSEKKTFFFMQRAIFLGISLSFSAIIAFCQFSFPATVFFYLTDFKNNKNGLMSPI